MALIETRLATHVWRCGWCGHLVHPGEVIAPVTVGSVHSSGCIDCAWKAENKQLREERETS